MKRKSAIMYHIVQHELGHIECGLKRANAALAALLMRPSVFQLAADTALNSALSDE